MARSHYQGVSEQARAGRERLRDARVLFQSLRLRGAMYLAGYAIECLLKTRLMKIHGCNNLEQLEARLRDRKLIPADASIYTHQLMTLLKAAQGAQRLGQVPETWKQFNLVNTWMPAWRYSADSPEPEAAQTYLEAIEEVHRWIEVNI